MQHRILILDSDTPRRAELAAAISRLKNTKVVIVADESEMLSQLRFGLFEAMFADADLLAHGASQLMESVAAAIVRPMLVIASGERADHLDPDFVSLVIRKPYDVQMLTGMLVAAIVDSANDATDSS